MRRQASQGPRQTVFVVPNERSVDRALKHCQAPAIAGDVFARLFQGLFEERRCRAWLVTRMRIV
jgi:hypothetical protein